MALRRYAVMACLALCGCVSPEAAPYVVEVTNPARYDADILLCGNYAKAYRAPSSVGNIGEAVVKGGADNAAGAAVNPLVPALGALGGGTSAVLDALRITSTKQRAVFLKCIDRKTSDDKSALVLEPN